MGCDYDRPLIAKQAMGTDKGAPDGGKIYPGYLVVRAIFGVFER